MLHYTRSYIGKPFTAEGDKKSEAVREYLGNPKLNSFDVWLRAKGEYLQIKGISLTTKEHAFENYIKETG